MHVCLCGRGGGVVLNKFLASTIFRAGSLLEDLWLLALNLVKQTCSICKSGYSLHCSPLAFT